MRRLRLAAGLSQRRLADLIGPGVSYAYVSRIESGTRQPSMKALRRLAPTLGVSVAYLETGREDPRDELLRQWVRGWGDLAPYTLVSQTKELIEV